MRPAVFFIILPILLFACKTPKLSERVPGRWQIEHYDEYSAARDKGSGHDFDECGYVEFRRGGVMRRISPSRPHGSLSSLQGAYAIEDSMFVIRDGSGATLERWLLTKDLTDYMEWVRVSDDRDSVFTMYLRK